ncbi:D-amino-acid transaminase [Paenactinomyces guangxiensis]|uniref:D-alanine aminotransferase n=1 Tax=Paenactinomyces guangxiensis TaxID=1490290 RepID=A0A7W1WRY8_9BACL|nr:D-amino-acid transaminase [Paenactinomyces guangxiensis]MBA4494946.1 D-amino-acid transaminase [Paenactinomyces guangxiensis]MBH8592029.1 D-amino-acid transaminase [Paenactinomyces guangxiensis]
MLLYDNRIIEREQARIDVEDRAYQFGDGVYEVIRVYGGQPFHLKEHLDRFQRSAREVRLSLPYPLEQLEEHLFELMRRTGLQEGNLYLQVSRGTAPRTHAFPAQARPLIIAYTQPSARPLKEQNQGICAVTTEDIRWLRCDIKSLNLLGAVLAKQKAADQGCQEAILIRDGIVTEGSSTNIFIVKDGTVWTHPADHLILHGITRDITLQLAAVLQISARTEAFDSAALFDADECFMTSTTMEICPIIKVDGQTIGTGSPGPVTRRLQEAFQKLIS